MASLRMRSAARLPLMLNLAFARCRALPPTLARARAFQKIGNRQSDASPTRSIAAFPARAFQSRPKSFEITGSRRVVAMPPSVIGVRHGETGSSQRWSEAMALPAIRASGPEPIQLPDVRRLDQTQSWPAWLASRVESMKDECQPALADGKYREIATLPASLILGPAERAEVERHICDLDALCKQTPIDGAEWEAATLILLTKLMLALPSSQQNEAGAEASGEAFQAALDDIPTWAVAAAVRRWYRGDCGLNERGQPYDYHWRPAPAELRRIALVERWRVEARAHVAQAACRRAPDRVRRRALRQDASTARRAISLSYCSAGRE
jgi:hypothetical protein